MPLCGGQVWFTGQPWAYHEDMKKSTAVKKAGSAYRLAKLLGVSKQAVSKWKNDKVPPLRVFELQSMRPEWFVKRGEK